MAGNLFTGCFSDFIYVNIFLFETLIADYTYLLFSNVFNGI